MPLFGWCEDKKKKKSVNNNKRTIFVNHNNSIPSVADPDTPSSSNEIDTGDDDEEEVLLLPCLTTWKPKHSRVVVQDEEQDKEKSDRFHWKNLIITLFEDILTMGNCLTGGPGTAMIIERPDGDEKDFHERYIEDRVLGQGEFGVVRLVLDMREKDESKNTMACKVLRKGVIFKDNVIFAPLKPEILMGEVEILRTLNGEHYCMRLMNVYETKRAIFIVTEYCGGGEMMEYISKQDEDLRTDDVSRIAFQLLDAINHCAQHKVIHRDIKPENLMFQTPAPGSDVRLIDFGSGTMRGVDEFHTTFAGSGFYISPELFQRNYSFMTDVWSAGVTIYVLVAGYPAGRLQAAFNVLHTVKRDLRTLPDMPDDMPDSFFDMLDGLLVYRQKKRKSAGELLDCEFLQFHKAVFSVEQIAMHANQDEDKPSDLKRPTFGKTKSISLRGSVGRHSMFLDYQKYQRSLTTLLATLLNKKELSELMRLLTEFLTKAQAGEPEVAVPETPAGTEGDKPNFSKKLDVLHMRELKAILKEQKHDQVLTMIDKLPGSVAYDRFAYDVALLKDFLREEDGDNLTSSVRSGGGGRKKRLGSGMNNGSLRSTAHGAPLRGSFRGGSRFGKKPILERDDSIHSVGSVRGRQNGSRRGTPQ